MYVWYGLRCTFSTVISVLDLFLVHLYNIEKDERRGSYMSTFDEEIQIAKAREHLIVKDNKLIQNVRRRKYELTALEQKILGFIISLIKPPKNAAEEPQYRYSFDVRLFCKVCGIDYDNGKNYANVKAALQKLSDNSFWIEEGDDEVLLRWIDSTRITKKSGKVSIRFSDEIAPYLFDLQERFTQYELYQTLALKGAYSIALYELWKSHSFKDKITVSIDDLKIYLSITDKYKEYKALRRKVIEPAVEEVNKYTDLNVKWEPYKQGRSYVAITFYIEKKKQWEGYEAYRRTMAELNGVQHIPGQINMFE